MMDPISFDASSQTLALSRRNFLQSCSVLVLCLSGCSTFLPKAHFAHLVINDPHPDAYHPILQALVATILPFEHPQFPPVSTTTMTSRLLQFFPFEEAQQYVALQRSVMFFNEIHLFPHVFAPMITKEEKREPPAMIAARQRHDTQIYGDFQRSLRRNEKQFTELSLRHKRAYFHLWGSSQFIVKRQLYRSVKSLVMIAAYSMDELWQSIRYEGPLIA